MAKYYSTQNNHPKGLSPSNKGNSSRLPRFRSNPDVEFQSELQRDCPTCQSSPKCLAHNSSIRQRESCIYPTLVPIATVWSFSSEKCSWIMEIESVVEARNAMDSCIDSISFFRTVNLSPRWVPAEILLMDYCFGTKLMSTCVWETEYFPNDTR